MYGRHDTLAEAEQTIRDRFHGGRRYEDAVIEWANEELSSVQEDLDFVVRGDEGFEDFLLTFIGREYERFHASDPAAVPYDSVRETRLCTCGDRGCELQQGKLPIRIREADDMSRGIREFKQEHDGDPLVLDHDSEPKGARQAWSEKRAAVWDVVRRVLAYLHKDREHPPGEVPDDEADDEADETAEGATA